MNASNDGPSSLRLTGRDRLILVLLLLFGAVTLGIGLRLFPTVFPEATIRFDVGRPEARARATAFVREQELDVSGYRFASSFEYDDTAKVFLEKELGLARMNEAVASTARIWRWSHRWFRPLQREEVQVGIAPSGEMIRFRHVLPEDAEGPRLETAEARGVAERHLARLRGDGFTGLVFLGASAQDLPNRRDHVFTWERAGVDWKGGRYRCSVRIQGDRLGGYEEHVQVPESWLRDYQRLRSRNTATQAVASVLYILSMIAMLVVFIQRIQTRMIRWRFALVFGTVGAVLILLSNLNSLPQELYGYETTRSYGGFVLETIVMGLLQAVVFGVLIAIMTASGETLYRSAYPRKIAIPKFFTWRGLRTKEGLFSTFGGLVLTCFFLAYQTVFYRIASSLGAWSPSDVPYGDLLNSAVPWAFLLFIGFMPSVTEEFTSRVFSIPFFSRLFRSRVAAVLVAGFIWGFGHAGYPNQPFYIRGLEVGIAGVVIGALMLRTNVVVLLIWHYTVDALYSGYLLLRSGDPYYVTTTILAGGIMVLPFLVALVAYLRTGRFEPADPLRNDAEPVALPSPGTEPETPAAPVAEGGDLAPDGEPGAVLTRRTRIVLAVASAGALVVALLVTASLPKVDPPLRVDRATAVAKAESFAREMSALEPGAKRAVVLRDGLDGDAARYVLRNGGVERLRAIAAGVVPAQAWSVRYYTPLSPRETRVAIDVTSGAIAGYERRIAEAESLATPPLEDARARAASLLASVGLDPSGMEIKESAEDARPRRVDRHFAWEAPAGDPRNVGEARYRLEAKTLGDLPAGVNESLRLPEAFERERERHTLAWGAGLALVLIGGTGLTALLLRQAGAAHGAGKIPWKRYLRIGIAGIAVAVVGTLNAVPRLYHRYETSAPWSSFLVLMFVGLLTAMVFYFFLGWAGGGILHGLHPRIALLRDRAARRRWLPDAILAFALAPVWAHAVGAVRSLLTAAFPAIAPPPPIGATALLDTSVPAAGAVVSALLTTFVAALGLGALTAAIPSRAWPGRPLRAALLVALCVGAALLSSRSSGEFAIGAARIAVFAVAILLFLKLVLRANPLAYVAAAYGWAVTRNVGLLLEQPSSWSRGHGFAALAILLAIPVLAVVMDGRRDAE